MRGLSKKFILLHWSNCEIDIWGLTPGHPQGIFSQKLHFDKSDLNKNENKLFTS